jgi:hypothetical protein
MKLDVVPPGQIATTKSPTFQKGFRLDVVAISKAIRGRNISCINNPKFNTLELLNIFLKSTTHSEEPILNMIRPNVIDNKKSIEDTLGILRISLVKKFVKSQGDIKYAPY